ncbi:MAG: family 43 glycosylhydrolase [Tannerellaceae bacterium]|jgi:GH43 family beta-xylosidase|nr:family 43 glycosylhydrolase [Tannerellaceae bacterium]
MKNYFMTLSLFLFPLLAWGQVTIDNPVLPRVADAGVMKHNGRYYIGGVFTNGDFYVSGDLVHWDGPVHAVTMDNAWATPFGIGNEQIHANDMHYINGVFHLYWSVNSWGKDRNVVHITHAEADHPLGPYRETTQPHWLDNRIDPHLFIDDDGSLYLYMVKFTDGNTIWVRPMKDPVTFEGEAQYVFASQPGTWETLDNRVAEGAWVIKYRNRYYLMYNTNHTSTQWGNYMLGVAEAASPTGFNQGNKYPAPVMTSNQLELEETFVDLLRYQDKGAFYYSLDSVQADWYQSGQDVSSWKKGKGGFGFPVTENSTTQNVKTIWNTPACFVYKPFLYDRQKNGKLSMRLHHTGAAKAWLNGKLIYNKDGADYRHIPIDKNLLADGRNTLAIESRRGRRSNFFDVALFDMKEETADDILYTPGQPNILRGPNGFEWWLVYMANKNAEARGQYINRVHFFGHTLTVDDITGRNTPGYHPAPAKPTYRYLSDTGQPLPPVNGLLPSIPATHYYFEAGIRSAANSLSDGITAWQSDEGDRLKIYLDAANKEWSYLLNRQGKQEKHTFPLSEDFKAGVFHTLAVFKNHTDFSVWIDNRPAPGLSRIETGFGGKGLPGVCSGHSNAEFDGITYTIGWDEYGDEIKGWEDSAETPGIHLKGDLLDAYEMSVQLNTSGETGLTTVYPVYTDAENYLKADFDAAQRQLIVSGKNKGKPLPGQRYPLARWKDYYASHVFSDFMERHFIFDTPITLDAVLLKKEAVYRSDTVIEDIHEKFHIYYTAENGEWKELNGVRHTAWEHPGFSRLAFPPVETGELVFVKKIAEDENFVMRDLSLQKIKVNEVYKQAYNFRVVKYGKQIRFFVDGKQICEFPDTFEKARVGIANGANDRGFNFLTLFHLPE